MHTGAPDNVVTLSTSDELFPHVEPGEYVAAYVCHAGAVIFHTPKLRVDFRLAAHPDIVLSRWYRVADFRGGRVRASRHSDLTREVSAVLGRRVRPDRITVAALANIYVTVVVRDVVSDRKQNPLAPVNRYSAIDRVIGRAL